MEQILFVRALNSYLFIEGASMLEERRNEGRKEGNKTVRKKRRKKERRNARNKEGWK